MGLKVSILTPSFNGERYFRDCLSSIHSQDALNFEHIVADGGSSDGTLRLLEGYARVKQVSAPDRGIYDALNKALAMADGDVIGILNCDDCYAPGLFKAVVEAFCDDKIMAVAGEAISFREVAAGMPVAEERFSVAGFDPLYMATLGTPVINAWFFRAAVFKQLGNFDAAFSIAGDREFLMRFALSGMPYRLLPRVVCCYRKHPASITFGGNQTVWRTILKEHHLITSTYLRGARTRGRARELLKSARTRDALLGAAFSLRQGRMGEFLSHVLAGSRYDPLWPARFALHTVRGLSRTLQVRSARSTA